MVWQKAHDLALKLYKITQPFPVDERFGLTSQIRRSATSICANIAEGCGRQSPRDFGRFVYIALGSASELECHLLLATDLGFITPDTYAPLEKAVTDIKRMLTGLIRRLMTDNRRPGS